MTTKQLKETAKQTARRMLSDLLDRGTYDEVDDFLGWEDGRESRDSRFAAREDIQCEYRKLLDRVEDLFC